ncbi:MAG: hypothetical protein ACQES0_11145 [Bacteroidota bacterium]
MLRAAGLGTREGGAVKPAKTAAYGACAAAEWSMAELLLQQIRHKPV